MKKKNNKRCRGGQNGHVDKFTNAIEKSNFEQRNKRLLLYGKAVMSHGK